MSTKVDLVSAYIRPSKDIIRRTPLNKKQIENSNKVQGENKPFNSILNKEIDTGLKFSAHAQKRLQERNIQFDASDMDKINNAVKTAADKGSKESLLLFNDTALVVSIKNNTVITAVNRDAAGGNVFTNIDSAILV